MAGPVAETALPTDSQVKSDAGVVGGQRSPLGVDHFKVDQGDIFAVGVQAPEAVWRVSLIAAERGGLQFVLYHGNAAFVADGLDGAGCEGDVGKA